MKFHILLVFSVFCIHCTFQTASPCQGEEYRNTADGILSMKYEDDRFSMETKDAPLAKVLGEFSRLAEVSIVSDGPVEDRVTVYMENLPVDEAARKVLRGKDSSFLFKAKKPGASPDSFRLSEIRIYVSDGKSGQGKLYSYTKQPKPKPPPPARSKPPPRPQTKTRTRVSERNDTPRDRPAIEDDPILSSLIEGDLSALDEIAEKLKEENPEVQDQIDLFLESLEEARSQAEASGEDFEGMEKLGNMGAIMQRLMRGKQK